MDKVTWIYLSYFCFIFQNLWLEKDQNSILNALNINREKIGIWGGWGERGREGNNKIQHFSFHEQTDVLVVKTDL